MHSRNGLWAAALLAIGGASGGHALAQPATQPATAPSDQATTSSLGKVVITSSLDQERDQIAPSLGATIYTQGPDQIQTIPGGDNAPFQQVLLRMPGVVEDSFGQEHVRGEHANVTFRINGVLLPQPLNGFGQEVDSHLIDSVTLIDGSLPAQFGFHTAGIIDIQTKTGESLQANEVSVYGGSYGTYESSFLAGGTSGNWDYLFTGDYKHTGVGIENPTASRTPIHDDNGQTKGFGYLSYHIDDTSRVSVMLNGSYANFQIPNTPGVPQAFALSGVPFFDSASLDENQREQEYYSVVSYQKTLDQFSFQASAFERYGDIHFKPDPIGDLIFNGVASEVDNPTTVSGLQFDSSYVINDQHTLRGGVIADYTIERANTSTAVFPTDANGNPTSDVPFDIVDDTKNHAWESGIYLQDEWRINPSLTLNFGARYDRFDSNFDTQDQVSPRVNLVWKLDDATTIHGGYARYFVPPPIQNVGVGTLVKFQNTTNQANSLVADPPKVETSHYFDAGVSHQINPAWQVNVDGFYKQAHNLVDLGQFGSALIFTPFNYREGYDYGGEISTTYKMSPVSLFGNFAYVRTGGRDIDSQQFQIDPDELAFIQNHYIHLDHDGTYTVSAGITYDITKNDLTYVDFLFGSGLRDGFANTGKLPSYHPINLGYQHVFHPNGGSGKDVVKLRFDVVNIADEVYELRDGSGIGVGAPQFGPRRGFFLGVAYDY